MRGIGLEEIAAATKISSRNLKALEDEKFNQLPGGIFNKGFVRAYAKFLGIDEEHIVAEYEAASHETEAAREEKLKVEFSKPPVKKDSEGQEISIEPKSQWGTIAAIVLVAVLAYGGYNVYQKKKVEREQHRQAEIAAQQQVQQRQRADAAAAAQAAQAQGVPSEGAPPEGTAPAEGTTAAPQTTPVTPEQKPVTEAQQATLKTPNPAATPSGPPFEVTMKVNSESWISVKVDGKLLVSGTLSAGTEKAFKGKDKIEMVLGKAGGVEVSYNGKPVENLGKGQDVRKITFTPSGYE